MLNGMRLGMRSLKQIIYKNLMRLSVVTMCAILLAADGCMYNVKRIRKQTQLKRKQQMEKIPRSDEMMPEQ